MATKVIKKTAAALDDITRTGNDIAGLKSSRYEKLQVSYGFIPTDTIKLGDVLLFSDVPSADIIRATLTVHEATPLTLEVLPGTNISNPLGIQLAQTGTPGDTLVSSRISYIIEYVRGTGKVMPEVSSPAALLDNTDEDGPETANSTAGRLKVASGDCLSVTITGS